jgi:hypothetical protein
VYGAAGSEWMYCRQSLSQTKTKLPRAEDEATALLLFGAIQRYMGAPRSAGFAVEGTRWWLTEEVRWSHRWVV